MAQTDIEPQIASLPMRVLVLASSDDPIAHFERFQTLDRGNVSVRKVEGRSHPGMAVIGSAEAEVLGRWLADGNGTFNTERASAKP